VTAAEAVTAGSGQLGQPKLAEDRDHAGLGVGQAALGVAPVGLQQHDASSASRRSTVHPGRVGAGREHPSMIFRHGCTASQRATWQRTAASKRQHLAR
jgi:hypothetical protein